jgi:hypothetical protein
MTAVERDCVPSPAVAWLYGELLRDLTARLDALTTEVEALGHDVGALDEALMRHDERPRSDLRRDLDAIDQRIAALESNVYAHERRGHGRD